MGRRPKWGRPTEGVLLLNKTGGMTSNSALQQAKRLFFAKRAGHTGSLDPLATGVLPICFGEATKFSQYLLDADKTYESTFRLGVKTETSDCEGEIVAEHDASHITEAMIEAELPAFRGQIEQIPSIYSALKYQGKPLYQLARDGESLPEEARKKRVITVYRYEIQGFRSAEECGGIYPEVDVLVECSKGTYIRTLAEDLGQCLGVGAHVIRLHRSRSGPFDVEDAKTLEQLQGERGDNEPSILDGNLLPVDAPVAVFGRVEITDIMAAYFVQGQSIMSTEAYRYAKEGDMVRVCSEGGQFLGLGELQDGNIAPKRIVNR